MGMVDWLIRTVSQSVQNAFGAVVEVCGSPASIPLTNYHGFARHRATTVVLT
jgi:hypothetical protein